MGRDMANRVIILGGSGIGMNAAYILSNQPGTQVVGFLNDVEPIGSQIGKFMTHPVLGRSEDVHRYICEENTSVFVAYVGLLQERKAYEKLLSLGIPLEKFASVIHSSAVIPEGYCSVGNGVMFMPFTQINADTIIGDNCILMSNSFVGHDSVLERFAHVASNAVVGAYVRVGKAVHIGSNATVREKVRLGDFSLIGSGAVVVDDVPENAIVVGNPARILRYKD
jgi:acetyltransferase EpsM